MKKTYSLTIKHGIYQAIIYFKGEDGERKSKWISLGIREGEKGAAKQAREKFEAIKREYEGVESADPLKKLFSAYLLEWVKNSRNKCAATTAEEYERMATRYINPYFDAKGTTLAKLTAGDLEDYYRVQRGNGLSAASVIKQHAIIRSTLQWAYKHRWVRENVADLAEKPKKDKPQREQPYTEAEVAALLKVLTGHKLYAPVMLAALFGLRRSEALGLRWSAVDFENRTITINTTVVRQHQGDKLVTTVRDNTTKTESSARILPLCDYTIDLFKCIKRQQERNRKLCGDCYDTRYFDFVCVDKMGTLINPDYVSDTFSKTLERNGLRHIRFHDLRHSCASILCSLGYNMKDIQTWLGHANYNFTADTYVHTEQGAHAAMAETYSNKIAARMPSEDAADRHLIDTAPTGKKKGA